MKNIIKNKKELVLGVLSIMAVLIAVIFTTVLSPNEQAASALNDAQGESETADVNAIGTDPDIINMNSPDESETAPEEIILTNPRTPGTPPTTRPPVTTIAPPATAPVIVDAPLADVEIPSAEVMAILEEFDIQVVEAPPVTQTVPPAEEQKPPGTTTVIDGKSYRWHEILGWVETGRSGNVNVMDTESSGYRYYIEPDGSVNLGKIVTPNGSVISYEEYQRNRTSRQD